MENETFPHIEKALNIYADRMCLVFTNRNIHLDVDESGKVLHNITQSTSCIYLKKNFIY